MSEVDGRGAGTNNVEIYQSHDGAVSFEVRTDTDTVWLTRRQLADLFGRDVKTIGKHIATARREELAGLATVANFATVQTEGDREVTRQVEHYNLDMILSVGYRVKSPEGVHFRRWASEVLRRYVVEGAAINERRIAEIGKIVSILSRSTDELVSGVADVLAQYVPGLTLLRDYDEGVLPTPQGRPPVRELTMADAVATIESVRVSFPQDKLFGQQRGDALAGIIAAIYQSFGGQDLYPSVEEKAANLLYLVVKDHPLADGNKRSAAALFVTFLDFNDALRDASGTPAISNNTLAALTLMVAMSEPREKDLMIALITNMLAGVDE